MDVCVHTDTVIQVCVYMDTIIWMCLCVCIYISPITVEETTFEIGCGEED